MSDSVGGSWTVLNEIGTHTCTFVDFFAASGSSSALFTVLGLVYIVRDESGVRAGYTFMLDVAGSSALGWLRKCRGLSRGGYGCGTVANCLRVIADQFVLHAQYRRAHLLFHESLRTTGLKPIFGIVHATHVRHTFKDGVSIFAARTATNVWCPRAPFPFK